MRRLCCILTALGVLCFIPARADKVVDLSTMPLYGKATDSTATLYSRLPASYEQRSTPRVWMLGINSAGLCIRFRSNATRIGVKWVSTEDVNKTYMPDTAIRGLDLYALEGSEWRYVGLARPDAEGKLNSRAMIRTDMLPVEREYLLNLSLYDGISSLQLIVNDDAYVEAPAVDLPTRVKPIVMYGTSILQGGCCSRPGMAYTNIIERRLNREVINLGFSGSAHLDMEIAELMAAVPDPAVYVLDNLPNCDARMVREKTAGFVQVLREAHPDTPIIFMENPNYPSIAYSTKIAAGIEAKNKALHEVFDGMKKAGMKNIYLIRCDKQLGTDSEATVDATHSSDLGMMRYADFLIPTLRKILKRI